MAVPAAHGRAPDSPADVTAHGWWRIAKRVVKGFMDDQLTDRAASLTYYAVMSLFPGLIVLAAALGLVGASATQPLIDNLSVAAPGAARDMVVGALENIERDRGAAGALLGIGLAAALWSASGYIGAFMRAANGIYGAQECRPFWKLRPLQIALTLMLVVLLAGVAFAVVLTGELARWFGDLVGVGDQAVTIWEIAKWPVIVAVVMTIFAALYWVAPDVEHHFRWVTPGSVMGVALWIVLSALFALYVAVAADYNKTYGALGGVVIFLVWLWLSNLALLMGVELNAELEQEAGAVELTAQEASA